MSNDQKPEETSNTTSIPPLSDEQGNLGDIQIALPVVENMVRMITLEVEGVVDVIGSGSGTISGIFSSKGDNKSGVRVVEDESGAYAIEIRVALEFGVELASVAYNLQSLVIERITKMTSKGVTKVDVFIDRVEKSTAKKVENKKGEPTTKTAKSEKVEEVETNTEAKPE